MKRSTIALGLFTGLLAGTMAASISIAPQAEAATPIRAASCFAQGSFFSRRFEAVLEWWLYTVF